jgi:DNA-binding GntR family transcriptional regulator
MNASVDAFLKPDIARVQHLSKKDLVYQILKDAVIDRRWRPGERKSFNELSALLHVSRTPVAEACKLLEKEGLVTIKPQVGVEAAYLSLEDLNENYRIRCVLEGLACTEAVKHLTDGDHAELDRMLAEMQEAEKRDDFPRFYDVNRAFHRLIYQSSRMPQLIRVLDLFWDSGLRYRFFYKRLPSVLEDANRHHREILKALKAGKKSKIQSCIEQDFMGVWSKLSAYFQKNGLPASGEESFHAFPESATFSGNRVRPRTSRRRTRG